VVELAGNFLLTLIFQQQYNVKYDSPHSKVVGWFPARNAPEAPSDGAFQINNLVYAIVYGLADNIFSGMIMMAGAALGEGQIH
jgi:uncharacterized membrane-anchored protein YitT (DUF2179 family)